MYENPLAILMSDLGAERSAEEESALREQYLRSNFGKPLRDLIRLSLTRYYKGKAPAGTLLLDVYDLRQTYEEVVQPNEWPPPFDRICDDLARDRFGVSFDQLDDKRRVALYEGYHASRYGIDRMARRRLANWNGELPRRLVLHLS